MVSLCAKMILFSLGVGVVVFIVLRACCGRSIAGLGRIFNQVDFGTVKVLEDGDGTEWLD